MARVYIYGLFNPITNQYFYVGATSQGLKKRLTGHMSYTDKNEKKVAIIQSILNYGERPQIVLLETVYDIDRCSEIELAWAIKLKNNGHPLANKSFNKAGCKPKGDAKVQISLYVTDEDIAKFGTIDEFKESIYRFINEYKHEPVMFDDESPNYIKSSQEEA